MESKIPFLNLFILILAALLTLFSPLNVFAQIVKYPGDECSNELRDNNMCVRDSGCIQTGFYDNGDPKYQCMCSEGRVRDPNLYCVDCSEDGNINLCGENAVCTYIEEIDAKRCVCNEGFVRNYTLNDGSCTGCVNHTSGFESFCDRGACVDGKCVCGFGYIMDPVNNTCVSCNDPWLETIQCNNTYANTSCFKEAEISDFVCMCPLGLTFNQDRVCSECNEEDAKCKYGLECIEGTSYYDDKEKHSYCYERCDVDDEAACDPRSTQKICTVPELNLGKDTHVCRCQIGYENQDDGTCMSSMDRLNCYTCNATTPCLGIQGEQTHFYKTCEVGDYCWTTANWFWNFDEREWENITYRRECHSNPCKNADEDFCMDVPYTHGHHICVSCCTTGLCNNQLMIPTLSPAMQCSPPNMIILFAHLILFYAYFCTTN